MNTSHIGPTVLWSLGGLFGILVTATVVFFFLKKTRPATDLTEVGLRIRSWWVMVSIFTLAMLLSRNVSLFFFAFISFLALKEYLSIIPTRRADRQVLLWAYLAIPLQYFWAGFEWYGMFIVFIPVYVFLFLPLCMVIVGETRDFLRSAGTLHWGLMTMVFSISHLDTMVLITLLPAALLNRVRPVAAADYFLATARKAWFALNIVGILPIKRQRDTPREDLLAPCYQALEDGNILIFFPEGSGGSLKNWLNSRWASPNWPHAVQTFR